ncbi:glutamate-gated chloride channel isoform X6 [Drosophila bipectinata]|uniref:glutamate-gated chloride channel isoform X6 n=1 Tax=Drosophila bipectinata TaxID=42026 RepID=UPI0038B28962
MRVFCSCGSVSASHISSAAGAAEAAPFEEVQWKSAQPKPSRKIQQRQKAETAPEAAPEEAEAAAATEEKPRSNSEASRSLHHRRLPRPSDKDASHTTLKMGSGHFFWAIFYFASLCSASLANNAKINFREKEKKVLDQILGAGKYDARIRPSGINGTDGPAIVRINLFVRSIMTISDIKMEYSVQLTFREQWTDERLKFDDIQGRLKYLTLTEANRVWMPDLFFSNEKEGHFHNIIMPNVYIRIFPNGSVLYSIRISLTLACPMNLKLYPLDRQICSLRMASYGWTTNDLVFLWKEGDPVQVVKNLHLPRFTLEKFLTDYCNSKTNTGEYSCLKVDLLFKREFSYYLIQIYIPCCMLVIVSWVSFWLDQGAVPARVSLGVTTLLTMATQTSGINASLPPVSYTKAIDVWTGVCLTFVFGALLEFALVNYASRSDMHKENMKKKRRDLEQASLDAASDLLDTDSNATFAMKPLVRHPGDPLALEKRLQCEVHMQAPKRPNCCKTWLSKFPTRQCSRSKRIDVISRITFPLVFALFNLVYWSTYLFREEEDETF